MHVQTKESIHARSSTFFDRGRGFADGIVRQTSESVFSKIRRAVGLVAGQKARRDPLCLLAATRVFFERDADPAKEAAHHRGVGFDAALGQKPVVAIKWLER